MQKWLYWGKVVVLGQKWLNSGKSCCIRVKLVVFSKVVVFGLYSGKVVLVGQNVEFGQKWL